MDDTQLILIVEDEDSLREALVTKLSNVGFETMEAKNGEEALEVSKSKRPDLILLDLMMPNMNGFDFLDNYMTDKENQFTKVIILTNRSDFMAQQNVFKKFPNMPYIIKANISLDEVVQKVKDQLGVIA